MALQKSSIGVTIETTVKENGVAISIASASTKNFKVLKPSGSVVTWAGSFVTDGTDGKLKYVTLTNDLDELGVYRFQVEFVIGSFNGRTEVGEFTVQENVN